MRFWDNGCAAAANTFTPAFVSLNFVWAYRYAYVLTEYTSGWPATISALTCNRSSMTSRYHIYTIISIRLHPAFWCLWLWRSISRSDSICPLAIFSDIWQPACLFADSECKRATCVHNISNEQCRDKWCVVLSKCFAEWCTTPCCIVVSLQRTELIKGWESTWYGVVIG